MTEDGENRIPQNWEDMQFERAKMLAQTKEQQRAMRDLKDYKSFQIYKTFLQNQYDQLVTLVLSMPKSQDDLVKNAYSAGQAAGIKIAMDLPEELIDTATAFIKSALIQEEEIQNGEEFRQAGNDLADQPGNGDEDPFDRSFGY